jgi:hypothetical protein
MIKYIDFCKRLGLLPQKGSSLRKYKKHLQLGIPLEYADKKHFLEAYAVNDSLKKAINYEKLN